MNDTGTMTIGDTTYDVIDVQKVGSSVLHILGGDLEGDKEKYIGQEV